MTTRLFTILASITFMLNLNAQRSNAFHTLNMPSNSPEVTEMQKLGVTQIEISYHSPALRDRDVWNNPGVIPQNGDPIPWRAGANMNTTITFSTDVSIEGQPLKAGTYGFHIIPNGNEFKLLFAHNHNQWGSYYLDIDKDITLSVDVIGISCEKSEQLDYEFLNRTENSVVIGLEWGEKRIPFTVSVDLNKTVVENLRSELRGINTYHWQAWNDAANWCLTHDTNLEEALEWAERSINGGYNRYAANKNLVNLTTKAKIEQKLNRTQDLKNTIEEALTTIGSAYDVNTLSMFLIRNKNYEKALELSNIGLKDHPGTWYIMLNHGICNYFLGKKKAALKMLEKSHKNTPDAYKKYVQKVLDEVKNGTYKL
ncbi:DUF2911 domain-containing protein [uncultured Winogradskyella sp.]|uniref:DUF2911 domain-containing protein n=1 Tax=uncultured Winogradskyella sp. TaxID=395353 RepID=UPI00262A5876|nr:DUF2911 domain-containing protein [uncultured Winogradskyella sp.]